MTARSVVAAMTAYALELREAEVKLNQNESPYDFPMKAEVLAEISDRSWNRYPDFEATRLRVALAEAHGLAPESVLAGNGSNELIAAAVGAFVGPGTPVVFPRPTFALYEKLVTIAGGLPVPVDLDPAAGLLPLEELLRVLSKLRGAVVIVCSPNNPTGGVLPERGLERLLDSGATVVFDRAYGEFARDALPPLHDRLVTFSTFSKAWGLAALRAGWMASTPATCRQVRKVKLPYSLNAVAETAAVLALRNREVVEQNVARVVAERERLIARMGALPGVTVFPSQANFIAFRSAAGFDDFLERGILVRAYDGFLRVSVGTAQENDRFLEALGETQALSETQAPARVIPLASSGEGHLGLRPTAEDAESERRASAALECGSLLPLSPGTLRESGGKPPHSKARLRRAQSLAEQSELDASAGKSSASSPASDDTGGLP